MRFNLLFGFILLFPWWLSAQSGGLQFEEGRLMDAMVKAQEKGKPLFVFACGAGFQPCEGMKEFIFPDENVTAFFSEHFVSWNLDYDQHLTEPGILGVEIFSLPQYFFFNADNQLLRTEENFLDAEELLNAGKRALNPKYQLAGLEEEFKKGNRNPAFLKDLIFQKHAARDSVWEAAEIYLRKLSPEQLLEKDNFRIAVWGLHDITHPAFKTYWEKRNWVAENLGERELGIMFLNCYQKTVWDAIARKNPNHLEKLKPLIAYWDQNERDQTITWIKVRMDYHFSTQQFATYFEEVEELIRMKALTMWSEWNEIAWNAVNYGESEKLFLRALVWVEESLKIQQNLYNLDTKARLLYLLGRKNEAISTAKLAIQKGDESGDNTSETEAFLDQINP